MRIIQNSFGEVRNVRISDLKTVPSTREPHTHTDDKKHTHRRRKRSDKLKLRKKIIKDTKLWSKSVGLQTLHHFRRDLFRGKKFVEQTINMIPNVIYFNNHLSFEYLHPLIQKKRDEYNSHYATRLLRILGRLQMYSKH
jgi:hypothetical protein